MRMYGLNVAQLVIKLIPVKIRGNNFMAWIGSLVQPVQSLNAALVSYVSGIRYDLLFTGQVIYLEHILNDVFDAAGREIYIDDPAVYVEENYIYNHVEDDDTLIIYNKVEAQPELYIFNAAEYNSLNVDFIVFVPDTVVFNAAVEVQMRAVIDRYRHVGRRYRFETYTP